MKHYLSFAVTEDGRLVGTTALVVEDFTAPRSELEVRGASEDWSKILQEKRRLTVGQSADLLSWSLMDD
jgi:hypothetical protein